MTQKREKRLEESMLLANLRDKSDQVASLKEELARSIQERDTLIKECAPWARTSVLCRATGLTRTQIWRISPGDRMQS